ncbi:MAG: hypothetical protein MZV64_59165 [Ignavibacteriales bacterium]|nr:hypothetical protein [Ignavibacteriales bacterium]
MGEPRGFKELFLTLSIQPAADVEDRHRHTRLLLFRHDLQVAFHTLLAFNSQEITHPGHE